MRKLTYKIVEETPNSQTTKFIEYIAAVRAKGSEEKQTCLVNMQLALKGLR